MKTKSADIEIDVASDTIILKYYEKALPIYQSNHTYLIKCYQSVSAALLSSHRYCIQITSQGTLSN